MTAHPLPLPDFRVCPYCGSPAVFRDSSAHLYHGKDWGPVWECEPCKAWVGCHKGSSVPLGRLANQELRRAKHRAHAAFDPIWQAMLKFGIDQGIARGATYGWLATALSIPPSHCHIGMFDVETCDRVVALCQAKRERDAATPPSVPEKPTERPRVERVNMGFIGGELP